MLALNWKHRNNRKQREYKKTTKASSTKEQVENADLQSFAKYLRQALAFM